MVRIPAMPITHSDLMAITMPSDADHRPSESTLGCFFFFNDTGTPEIYPLSLPDALPISASFRSRHPAQTDPRPRVPWQPQATIRDRKSTRLNSSHLGISYAVFCLKK